MPNEEQENKTIGLTQDELTEEDLEGLLPTGNDPKPAPKKPRRTVKSAKKPEEKKDEGAEQSESPASEAKESDETAPKMPFVVLDDLNIESGAEEAKREINPDDAERPEMIEAANDDDLVESGADMPEPPAVGADDGESSEAAGEDGSGKFRIGREINDRAFTEDRNEDVLSKSETADNDNWKHVQDLNRSKAVVEVKLVGTQKGVGSMSGQYAIAMLYGFPVLIPFKEFFVPGDLVKGFNDLNQGEQERQKDIIARGMQGARIVIVVKGASRTRKDDGYAYAVAGSRKEAMTALKQAYFFKRKGSPIQVGDVVKCRVLTVAASWIKVETLGCVTYINAHELGGRTFIWDCRNQYYPGQIIKARISDLQINSDESVYITVSERQLAMAEGGRNLDLVQKGGTYVGTVRSCNHAKRVYTVVLDCGVIASVTENHVVNGARLYPKDRVSVRVTNKRDTYVFGIATKLPWRI